MTKGEKSAKKVELPKPRVEKVDEPKPAEDAAKKITDKKEIPTTAAAEPPPPPPAEAKPEKKPEKSEPKTDAIAEALKKEKEEAKKQEKVEAKLPVPPKKPVPPQPKFDAAKVAALLDKRDPQRHALTGQEIATVPTLGTATGRAPQLSQSEFDALRARLMQLWSPPVGIKNPEDAIVRVLIRFKPDGTLADGPRFLNSGRGSISDAARESALRAILRGQPYTMLRRETYETWQEIEITFDPRDMFRG
jgi:colicin import membrane protein